MVVRACRLLVTGDRPVLIVATQLFCLYFSPLARGLGVARLMTFTSPLATFLRQTSAHRSKR
jgi:hypothetical protein